MAPSQASTSPARKLQVLSLHLRALFFFFSVRFLEFICAYDHLWELTPELVLVGVNALVGGKQEFRLPGMSRLCCPAVSPWKGNCLEGVSGSEPGR